MSSGSRPQGLVARRRRLADAMAAHDLDALVVVGSGVLKQHGYLDWVVGTAPLTRPAWAILRPGGELLVIAGGLADAELMRTVAPAVAVAAGPDERSLAQAAAEHLASRGLDSGRIGVIGRDTLVSAGALRAFEADLPDAAIHDARALADELKALKDPDELEALRDAGAIAEAAYERVVESARPGVTAAKLAGAAHGEARRRGARDALVFIGSGRYHGVTPEPAALQPGSLVTVYVEVLSADGYWIEHIGMLAFEPLGAPLERLAATATAALAAGERELRAGVPSSAPAVAMEDAAREAGLDIGLSHSLGHGAGAGDEDAPRIAVDERRPLRAGMVAVLHPNVVDAGAEVSATAGATYLVRAGAPERLSPSAAGLTRVASP